MIIKRSINAWFISQINMHVRNATLALEGFQTRKALQESLFLLKKDIDHYFYRIEHDLENESFKEEIDNVLIYLSNIWIRLMAPFIPHSCEELWSTHGGLGFVSESKWPKYDANRLDEKVQRAEEVVMELSEDIKEIKKILNKAPQKIHVYIAPQWKWKIFDIAWEVGKPDIGRIMQEAVKQKVHDNKKELAIFAKKIAREMTKINYVGKIDEYTVINDSLEFLSRELGAEILVYKEPTYDPEGKSGNALPYKPAIYIE
jgi:leucyl-tRNA synthetase